MGELDLPAGWVRAPLAELLTGIETGKSFKCDERPPKANEVGVVKVSAVSWGEYRELESKTCLDAARINPDLFVQRGDFLFSRSNTIDLVGACVIAQQVGLRVMLSDKILRFRFADDAMKPWVLGLLRSHQGRAQIEKLATGNQESMRNIGQERIGQIEVPLPPSAEQARIVAKIDELFSELDQGIEALKTAQAQLKVYRQALLKHAFEGRLTADWRASHPDKLLPPDQLLAGIQQAREARHAELLRQWQAAHAAWEAGGKVGDKPAVPKEPEPVAAMSTEALSGLPPLPHGWVYVSLSSLGELGRGKSKHRPRNDPALFGGPYPFIQTGEVKAANGVVREHVNTYSELGLRQSKLWPKGTLCITIAANIAQTAFLGFDCCFPDSVVGFTAADVVVVPEYVDLFIQSARTRIEAYAPATAQKNINLETLENLVVPFCSLDEQRALLDVLASRLSVVEHLEATIANGLQQSEALRQSILKKAFSGQLVAQDPTDEPASALLARIRAARSTQAAKRAKPRHRSSTAAD